MKDESTDSLVVEIRAVLMRVKARLPSSLEKGSASPNGKLPVKTRSHSEAVLWRAAELGENAFDAFERNELAAGMVLTRALVETSAALWFVAGKLDAALKAESTADLEDWLAKMLAGSGADPDLPEAMNLLNFTGSAIHSINVFRHNYAVLSRFSHPDWMGTRGLYSALEPQGNGSGDGQYPRSNRTPKAIGLVTLSLGLEMAEHSYRAICEALPDLTKLCPDLQTNP